jgi:hypothetical protein
MLMMLDFTRFKLLALHDSQEDRPEAIDYLEGAIANFGNG